MSEKCPKKCPKNVQKLSREGVKTHSFWCRLLGNFSPITCYCLVTLSNQCSPVTTACLSFQLWLLASSECSTQRAAFAELARLINFFFCTFAPKASFKQEYNPAGVAQSPKTPESRKYEKITRKKHQKKTPQNGPRKNTNKLPPPKQKKKKRPKK